MYFVSEHPMSEGEDFSASLIGFRGNYLYSAHSSRDELKVYRKKAIDSGEWKAFWSAEISNVSLCACENGISAAYGIVGNRLFAATFGSVSNTSDKYF